MKAVARGQDIAHALFRLFVAVEQVVQERSQRRNEPGGPSKELERFGHGVHRSANARAKATASVTIVGMFA